MDSVDLQGLRTKAANALDESPFPTPIVVIGAAELKQLLDEREALLGALRAIDAHWTSGNFSRERGLWNAMAAAIAKAALK